MTAKELAENQKYIVVGHRGYPHRYPENSLIGYREAVRVGVDLIEVDVNLSKDREPMVIHDTRIDRLSNGHGLISDYTMKELRQLDFGFRKGPEFAGLHLPTLYEVCEMVKDDPNALMDVDIKVNHETEETLAVALRVLEEYKLLDRCVFNCCDCAVLKTIRRDLGLLTVGTAHFSPDVVNFETGPEGSYKWMWALCVPHDMMSKEWADYFHHLGIRYGCVAPEENLELALACDMDFAVCDNPIPYLQALGRNPRP